MRPLGQALAGHVVVVTTHRAEDLSLALTRRGATVLSAPPVRSLPHPDPDVVTEQTHHLIAHPPQTLILTSGSGLRRWLALAAARGMSEDLLDVMAGARVVARGPRTRAVAHQLGLTPDWVAEADTTSEVLEVVLSEGVGRAHIAVQLHHEDDGLAGELVAAGADVSVVVPSVWGPAPDPAALTASVRAAADGEVDAVLFTSAQAVRRWLEEAEAGGTAPAVAGRLLSGSMVAAAIGPGTASPLVELGVDPLVPERARLGLLVQALVRHVEQDTTTRLATSCGALEVRRTVALLEGHVLALPPGGLEVLRLLAGARGEIVTRRQVLEVLPGFSRDPHAADVAIARLREAVSCRAFVETVVRRGYRLALA